MISIPYILLIFLIFCTLFCILNLFTLLIFEASVTELIKELYKKQSKTENQKKLFKRSKKIIARHNKRKGTINYDATKFEYRILMCFVNIALGELTEIKEKFEVSDLYILKHDYYFRELNLKKYAKNCSIEGLACLIKAIIEEPIVNDEEANLSIVFKLVELFSSGEYLMLFNYDGDIFASINKHEIINKAASDYIKYKNDVYLIALFLLNSLNI